MSGLWTALLVMIGGALGAVLRGLAEQGGTLMGTPPWCIILAVNVQGCFAIGFLLVWLECRLRRDGASQLAAHPRRHQLASWLGVLTPDPTLPAPEVARSQQRLRFESGFLMTGVLGGFTTFSSFALDVVTLWESGHVLEAALNIGLSMLVGVLAAIAGLELGIRYFGAQYA